MTELQRICEHFLDVKKLSDEKHISRLKLELREIEAQGEDEYFLDLHRKSVHFPENENNLLTPYLLDIVEDFDITKEPKYNYGEYPDVDVDYIPEVRQYLKDEFTRKQYGNEYVCNIATYTTFGLRSSLIDMAKVLGYDRSEIIALPPQLNIKDDEGETLSWDKALELYDDLREYLEAHPDVADAAQRIMNRNRNIGQHASGVIISGVPISDFCPLVMPKGATVPCAAWVEGLHGTDLGAVGLVKFDFLSLEGNMKNAMAIKYVVEDSIKACNVIETAEKMVWDKIGYISAKPGQGNWSDTSYLNDPKCLEMANRGDLKMIFQFDGSEGIRHLVRQGGVTSFDDLVAYTALYRPGPMKKLRMKVDGEEKVMPSMAESYIARKRGQEEYEVHPVLEPFLGVTYGILVYQEQVMRILNVVGKIPLKDCEAVRKAISKKNVDKFKKYKEMFVENGQKVLGWTATQVEQLWEQIEAFAGYGFNLSHSCAYTYISSRMLYLKCHHPAEFYASVLSCTKAASPKDYKKIKGYKREIEKHGIRVHKVDLNKSGFDCRIIDGKIYWPFSKIRSVGDDTAMKIAQLQPYFGFEDFLKRFGTDAKVVQALIGLRLFTERDPETLYKFSEVYRKYEKKKVEREKKHKEKMAECRHNLEQMQKEGTEDAIVKKYARKVLKMYETYKKKQDVAPTLADFCASSHVTKKDEILKTLISIELSEQEYYGFVWTHPLESCPKQRNFCAQKFEEEQLKFGPLEILISGVHEKKGKKGNFTYFVVEGSDILGESCKITVWKDDYSRFKDDLKVGYMVRLQVQPPLPPFTGFTLNSIGTRWKKPPKEVDKRVIVLQER